MKKPDTAKYPGLASAGLSIAPDPQLYPRIGERIAAAREAKRLKQDELGEMIAESAITISRWENASRKPNIEDLDKLGRALGRDLLYFVSEVLEDSTASLRILNRNLTGLTPEDEEEILMLLDHKLLRRRINAKMESSQ